MSGARQSPHCRRDFSVNQLLVGLACTGAGSLESLVRCSRLTMSACCTQSCSAEAGDVACRGLQSLVGLTNLRHLNLSDTATTDHAIGSLSRMKRLQYLNLSHSGALQPLIVYSGL